MGHPVPTRRIWKEWDTLLLEFEDKNMEQNLMEEYEDQELTVDLIYKSS